MPSTTRSSGPGLEQPAEPKRAESVVERAGSRPTRGAEQPADRKTFEFLSTTSLFAALDALSLARLSSHLRSVPVPAGAVLMREGDPSDALYVVVSGRFRATVNKGGQELAVGEIGRGEAVGEMGLLTGEPRSATVRALRDSHVLRLSRSAFARLVDSRPEALTGITRLVISRLRRTLQEGLEPSSAIKTVAVVPAGVDEVPLLYFSDQLTKALRQHGTATLLNRERLSSHLRRLETLKRVGERTIIQRLTTLKDEGHEIDLDDERADARTTEWLHNLEASRDFVVYQCDPRPSAWTTRCLRQADRILLVARASSKPTLGEIEDELFERTLLMRSRQTWTERDLVLLHPRGTELPEGTARWLDKRPVQRHHHVRLNHEADLQRLSRVLAQRQVGLVLGGGGARGIAHVGVIKALEEHGIPIDSVGGTSFGAIMAAGPASGWTAEMLRDGVKRALVDPGRPIDYTMPYSALTKGKKATEQIRRIFGDVHIEDLWLPYYCVSSNISRGVSVVHDRGPLWKALRASVAIPGVLPPVRSRDGDVLVDGGVMNNLPVGEMRGRVQGGLVMAVNVRAAARLSAEELSDEGVLSGWKLLARRFAPFVGRRPAVPGIVELILRTSEMGDVLSTQMQEGSADFTFHPPVAGVGLLEFEAVDRLVAAGYEHAVERLAERPPEILRRDG